MRTRRTTLAIGVLAALLGLTPLEALQLGAAAATPLRERVARTLARGVLLVVDEIHLVHQWASFSDSIARFAAWLPAAMARGRFATLALTGTWPSELSHWMSTWPRSVANIDMLVAPDEAFGGAYTPAASVEMAVVAMAPASATDTTAAAAIINALAAAGLCVVEGGAVADGTITTTTTTITTTTTTTTTTMVVVSTISLADEVATQLGGTAAGAEAFTGKTSSAARHALLAKLVAGQLRWLICTTAGITGIDAPARIRGVVMVGAAVRSAVDALQLLGRLRGRGKFVLVEW